MSVVLKHKSLLIIVFINIFVINTHKYLTKIVYILRRLIEVCFPLKEQKNKKKSCFKPKKKI